MDVKCPWCSAVLRIKSTPEMEGKIIKCPVCKHSSPFTNYKIMMAEDLGDTQMPGNHINNAPEKLIIGKLIVPSLGVSYQLNAGANVIGRKASASKAHFQIDTGTNKRMSREHLIIEVKRIPSKGFTHHVSLFKERVNKTFVNSSQLLWGDKIILQHGDRIKLPDMDLRFELPDEEATQL